MEGVYLAFEVMIHSFTPMKSEGIMTFQSGEEKNLA